MLQIPNVLYKNPFLSYLDFDVNIGRFLTYSDNFSGCFSYLGVNISAYLS